MSCGTAYNHNPWDAKMHDIRDKQWSDVHQTFVAKMQTSWFVSIVSRYVPVADELEGY